MNKTKVWAHRGASGYAPENTIVAFRKAVEMSADGIELDVQLTADGEIVVTHDEEIDRVSDGSGFVKNYTLEELRRLNFNKNNPEYKNVTIPTLFEVFELMYNNDLTINIELKTGLIYYAGLEKKLLALVDRMQMNNRIIYSSFNHYSLKKIKSIEPKAKIGLLCGRNFIDVPGYTSMMDAAAIHPPVGFIDGKEYVAKCRANNLQINTWTVNEETDMKRLVDLGVDAIITNYPDNGRKIADGGLPKPKMIEAKPNEKQSLLGKVKRKIKNIIK